MSDWQPAHDAMLRENFNAGLSYEQSVGKINRKFGTGYSRNAAIGRSNRIGLRTPKKAAKPKPVRVPRATPAQRPDIAIRKAKAVPKPPTPAQLRCDPLKAGTFHVTELEAGMCRYPSGDRDIRFCGLGQVKGSSYCGRHHELATNHHGNLGRQGSDAHRMALRRAKNPTAINLARDFQAGSVGGDE